MGYKTEVSLEDYVGLKIRYAELKEKYLYLKKSLEKNSVAYNINDFKTKHKEGFNRMEIELISDEIPSDKKEEFNDIIINAPSIVINNSLIVDREVVISAVTNAIVDSNN